MTRLFNFCNYKLSTFSGQFGNSLDAKASKSFMGDDANTDSSSDEDGDVTHVSTNREMSRLLRKKKQEEAGLPCHSTTLAQKPLLMNNKNYLYMEYGGNKPCMYVVAMLEDLRKRMYHANLLEHIYETMVIN